MSRAKLSLLVVAAVALLASGAQARNKKQADRVLNLGYGTDLKAERFNDGRSTVKLTNSLGKTEAIIQSAGKKGKRVLARDGKQQVVSVKEHARGNGYSVSLEGLGKLVVYADKVQLYRQRAVKANGLRAVHPTAGANSATWVFMEGKFQERPFFQKRSVERKSTRWLRRMQAKQARRAARKGR
jgi:hypothetical protein